MDASTKAFQARFCADVEKYYAEHKHILDGIEVQLKALVNLESEGLVEYHVVRQGDKIDADDMVKQLLCWIKHSAGDGGVVASPIDCLIFSDSDYGILEMEMLAMVGFTGTIKRKEG
jgi:hypothetical protein